MTEGLDFSGLRSASVVFRLEISDFGAFYERTYDSAYRTALGILRDPALAADVTQEAYVAAYRHRHRYRGEAPSTVWLHRIVVNQAFAALRRRRATPVRDLSPWMAPDLAGGSVARLTLLQALDVLPARQRAAVILRYYTTTTTPRSRGPSTPLRRTSARCSLVPSTDSRLPWSRSRGPQQ